VGGSGCFGFGPKALAISRWWRLTLDRASCRAYCWSPMAFYCGLVSEARNATTSSIGGSVNVSGCMSFVEPGVRDSIILVVMIQGDVLRRLETELLVLGLSSEMGH